MTDLLDLKPWRRPEIAGIGRLSRTLYLHSYSHRSGPAYLPEP